METIRPLSIKLFNGFCLRIGEEDLAGFETTRLINLLAYLLLNRGQPISRSRLACSFWPDSNEKQAHANLRNLLYYLRRNFPYNDQYISVDRLTIEWRMDAPYWFDVAAFEDHLSQARAATSSSEKVHHYEAAVKLYSGELLPGHFSDWLLVERQRLAQAYEAALGELVSLYESTRQYQDAIRHTRGLIHHDPLQESPYQQMMRLQASIGNHAAALHTYHSYATLLRREMGVEPGQPLRELYDRLTKHESVPEDQSQMLMAVPLVGREKSWQLLRQTWRRAVHQPKLVLIEGEAGIGKTHLAEAFVDWVKRQGITVLSGRCYPTEDALAYAPIISWLRGRPLPDLQDHRLQALMPLLPEIGGDHPELPGPELIDKEWQRVHLFSAIAAAIRSGQKSLLIFLDDLQWCDKETLDWLLYLMTAQEDDVRIPRLMVIAGLRSEGGEINENLKDWQARLIRADNLVTINLRPLNQDDTLALASHVRGAPLKTEMGPILYQTTEGHPFYIVELMRAALPLSSDGSSDMHSLATTLPSRVRQVLEARLAQLSSLSREVIAYASVIGRDFSYSILERVSRLSEDELVGCLDECWRRRIIREQGEDTYDFSHDKLREVAYINISHTQRRWYHKQVAETMSKLEARLQDQLAAVIAEHYEAAGQLEKAVEYYQRASETALKVYAHEEAMAALEKGLQLLERLLDKSDRDEHLAYFHEKIGDVRASLAQHDAAQAAYEHAQTYTALDHHFDSARLQRKIGKTLENKRAGYEQVMAAYVQAQALLGPMDPNAEEDWWAMWCDLQNDRLDVLYWWQHTGAMGDLITELRPLIEKRGSPIQLARFYLSISEYIFLRNAYHCSGESVYYAQKSLEALPDSASLNVRAVHHFAVGFNLLWSGDYDKAISVFLRAKAMFEKTGDLTSKTRNLTYLVVAYRLAGNEEEVERFAKSCLKLASSVKMYDYMGVCQAALAWLALRPCDGSNPDDLALTEAERRGRLALEAWENHGSPYSLQWMALWPLIDVALSRENLSDAIVYVRKLFDSSQQMLDSVMKGILSEALEAWDTDRREETRQLLNKALSEAKSLKIDLMNSGSRGETKNFLG